MTDKSYQRWRIYWTHPIQQPPNNLPVVLAEHVIETEAKQGAVQSPELNALYEQHKPPTGFAMGWGKYTQPPKTQEQEKVAKNRVLRMQKKIRDKYPLFADELIERELTEKKDYYAGIMDEKQKKFRAEITEQYHTDIANAKNSTGVKIYKKWWKTTKQEQQKCKTEPRP